MANTYVVVGVVGGALAGGVQTPLLREYADNPMAVKFLANPSGTPPVLMKQLKGFGSLSALVGIGAGVGGLAAGYITDKHGKGRYMGVSEALYAYGAASLGGGIVSGALPTSQWTAAIAADPARPGFVRPIIGGATVFPSFPPARTVTVVPVGAAPSTISAPTSNQIAAKSLF